MSDLLQFCTDRELMEELQRRIDASSPSSTPPNYEQSSWTCSSCGMQVWPNLTHVCPSAYNLVLTSDE